MKGDQLSALKSFVKAFELNPFNVKTVAFTVAMLEKLGKFAEANLLKTLL